MFVFTTRRRRRHRVGRAAAATVAFVALVWAFLAVAPAIGHADTPADAYAATNGANVCQLLDEHNTVAGVGSTYLAVVTQSGLSWVDSAAAMATAVRDTCPRNAALVLQWTDLVDRNLAK